jgi:hypothetical protein
VSVRAPRRLHEFVALHPDVEAVLQHVGLRTWDLVLVDLSGLWVREEVRSEAEAEALCADLRIRLSRGWEDARIARRMAARNHWTTSDGQRRAL